MRIAVGQVWQETNTFNPLPTTRADFEAFGILRGDDLVTQMADTNEPGGFIQALRAWPERPEIVGLVRLPAWPGGIATAETFAWLRDEVLSAVRKAGKVDGVLLALHGAMVAEGEPDVEGAILEAVRREVGRVPVVPTLDLHASVTERMVRNADALVLYHTAPHIDVFETGQRGAAVLRRLLIDGVAPVMSFARVPMVPPAERANTQDPASVSHGLCQRLRELERHPDILSAGIATVQPWLDIPDHGSAVVVVGTDKLQTERTCAALATTLWEHRRDYLPQLTDLAPAVELAHRECGSGLIVLSDSADSTTSGAPGDSVHVLAELLRYDWPRAVLVPLVDPGLAALQPGTTWEGTIGGKRDIRSGKSITRAWHVDRAYHAKFTLSGHLGKNLHIDMGPGVVLSAGNVHVLVTSRSGPHFAPQLFQAAGFDPFAAAVLIAKSPCGFRAAYAERAHRILVVRAPGCAPSDFWNYPYANIPRPLWPWDDAMTYEPRVLTAAR